MRVGVFLDRDGVLNELVERDGIRASPRRLADFRLLAGAAAAVRRLQERGCLVFVVTNQPDVGRGHLSAGELERMHRVLLDAVRVQELVVCPHDDADGCDCRKPKPGMLVALAARWGVDLARSYVVGDSWKDVEAGRRAGCRTVLIGSPDGRSAAADAIAGTLEEAVRLIEAEQALRGKAAHGVHP